MIPVQFLFPDRRVVNMRLPAIPRVIDQIVLFDAIYRVVNVTWEFDAPGLQTDDPRQPVIEPSISVFLSPLS